MTERQEWEGRHRAFAGTPAPSAFIAARAADAARSFPGGLALDLACGSGRHTRLLAGLGFRTVAVDFARSALERAASARGPALPVLAEAARPPFADRTFHLIVQTNFLDRSLFPSLARLLRPGGLLLVETFSVTQHERTGHPRREYCLLPGELEQLCTAPETGLEIVDSQGGDYGDSERPLYFSAIAARRP